MKLTARERLLLRVLLSGIRNNPNLTTQDAKAVESLLVKLEKKDPEDE